MKPFTTANASNLAINSLRGMPPPPGPPFYNILGIIKNYFPRVAWVAACSANFKAFLKRPSLISGVIDFGQFRLRPVGRSNWQKSSILLISSQPRTTNKALGSTTSMDLIAARMTASRGAARGKNQRLCPSNTTNMLHELNDDAATVADFV